MNKNVDSNTHYDTLKDVFVVAVFKNPDANVNTVSLGQHGKDYKPNADLE